MKTSLNHIVVVIFTVVCLLACTKDEISYPKDGLPHLNCVDNFTTEFPFTKSVEGILVTDVEYVRTEMIFNDDGTFCVTYREACSDPLEGRYCSMTEEETFSLKINGVWGPHSQTVTEHNSNSHSKSFGGPTSPYNENYTYNQLKGQAPFTVLESNFDHYLGQSGIIKYAMKCYPIKGTPLYPPYRYFREVTLEFDDDSYDLMIAWQTMYNE